MTPEEREQVSAEIWAEAHAQTAHRAHLYRWESIRRFFRRRGWNPPAWTLCTERCKPAYWIDR